MKTKEELEVLKSECKELDTKLTELSDDELSEVTGGFAGLAKASLGLKGTNDLTVAQALSYINSLANVDDLRLASDSVDKEALLRLANNVDQLKLLLELKERLGSVDDLVLKQNLINFLK